MSLPELLKIAASIADDRYAGDFSVARIEGTWKVSFRRRNNPNGFTWIEVGEGSTFEKALENACEIEVAKAESELDMARQFIRKVGSKRKQ